MIIFKEGKKNTIMKALELDVKVRVFNSARQPALDR